MSSRHLLLELSVEILVESHILEHALQFARVLETAGVLELGDHVAFGVVGSRGSPDETGRQHLGVELLEDVFILDVLEDGHLSEREGGEVGNQRAMKVSCKLADRAE